MSGIQQCECCTNCACRDCGGDGLVCERHMAPPAQPESPWRSLRDDPPKVGMHILMRDALAVGFSTLRISMPEMIELMVRHSKYTDYMEIPE